MRPGSTADRIFINHSTKFIIAIRRISAEQKQDNTGQSSFSVYQGKIYDKGFKAGGYYVFSNATPVGVEWTGLRAGVGLSLLIGK